MEKYDSYRPSGIPWLTEIPSHWGKQRLKYLLKEVREKSETGAELPLSLSSSQGLIPSSEKTNKTMESASYVGAKIIKRGQIVFNRFKARLFALSQYDGLVSPDYAVYIPSVTMCSQYMVSLFGIPHFRQQMNLLAEGVGDGFSRLYSEDLFKLQIPVPPLSEQKSIVDYLDRETQMIDAFIAAKEKELALLDELKQAEIANAITHGLNPDAPMKHSGISWLGDIPAHWEVNRMSTQFIGKVDANSDFYYKRAFKFNYGALVPKNEVGTDEEYKDTYVKYTVLKQGDIVLNGLNLNYDFVSQRVAICREPGIITSAYVVCRPRPSVYADYFCYLFKGMDAQKLFHGMGTGIRLTLSFEELKKQLLPIPPVDEQKAIVDYIEHKCDTINCLSSNIEQEIAHLKEYKQRLIADAVTGQIKVC